MTTERSEESKGSVLLKDIGKTPGARGQANRILNGLRVAMPVLAETLTDRKAVIEHIGDLYKKELKELKKLGFELSPTGFVADLLPQMKG
jgi:hypothetical protein